MLLRFTKMHGLGNDFAVVDLVTQHARITPEKVRRLADRHLGIGFDQMLLVEPPGDPDMDFRYRIFNADGSEVEQCGNGARCFARFVLDHRLTIKKTIRVETAKGNILLEVLDNGDVRVDMGTPELTPANIPYRAPQQDTCYELKVDDQTFKVGVVATGNPHCVTIVNDIEQAPVADIGPKIEHHPDFPERCNVGFMQILSPQEIRLRVWERGVGETMACGTGACAAVISGRLQGLLDEKVKVHLRGGPLTIEWPGKSSAVIMTGSATRVFEGQTRL